MPSTKAQFKMNTIGRLLRGKYDETLTRTVDTPVLTKK